MTKQQIITKHKKQAKQRYNLVARLRADGVEIDSIERVIKSPMSVAEQKPIIARRIEKLLKLGYAGENKLDL